MSFGYYIWLCFAGGIKLHQISVVNHCYQVANFTWTNYHFGIRSLVNVLCSHQLPCRGWGWHNGNYNAGAEFWHSWEAYPETFTALWRLWESGDACSQPHVPYRTPTASSQRSKPTREDDQSTPVSTEGSPKVLVEAPFCLALSRTCRCGQAELTCKWLHIYLIYWKVKSKCSIN